MSLIYYAPDFLAKHSPKQGNDLDLMILQKEHCFSR